MYFICGYLIQICLLSLFLPATQTQFFEATDLHKFSRNNDSLQIFSISYRWLAASIWVDREVGTFRATVLLELSLLQGKLPIHI